MVSRTDVGRVRKTNEDAVLVADMEGGVQCVDGDVLRFPVGKRGTLLALSDGMGGHRAGDVASALTLSSLHRALADRPSLDNVGAKVIRAVEHANLEVLSAGQDADRRKMGATLTAVFVVGTAAHIAEIGDSRGYLLRSGEIHQLTHDQSFAQVLLDAGATDVEDSPMRSVLVQAIGQKPDIKVALGMLLLRHRDCLLLCSDGLWGKLSAEEMRDVVLSSPTLDAACDRMVAMANERGGNDNITVLLAGVSGDVPMAHPDEGIANTFQVLTTFDAPVK